MNRGQQLLDKEFILGYFNEHVKSLYRNYRGIKDISIHPYKDHLWGGDTYHLVIEYRTEFINQDGSVTVLPIFCTAHSSEPRKKVYESLKFLWDNGFSQGDLTIPHPLFYSEHYRGTFYRGVEGRNLYQYIREGKLRTVEGILPQAARWFAKLHAISPKKARNFNEANSRIRTVYPGAGHILKRIGQDYPGHREAYARVYDILMAREEGHLDSTAERCLVHGDAHPENVIKMSERTVAVIDFTDLSLADYARDIGSFLQQLEFMVNRKIADPGYAAKAMKIFRDSYFEARGFSPDEDLEERIMTYYYWTMMRTASHFLLEDKPEPERAYPLIDKVCRGLSI